MTRLEKKYVLHIPLTKYVDGELFEIDLDDIFDELICDLNREGFDGFYITHVESHYKSRIYDEKLITIFTCGNSVEGRFRQWFFKNNDILCQEAFAYELNNVMFIESFD